MSNSEHVASGTSGPRFWFTNHPPLRKPRGRKPRGRKAEPPKPETAWTPERVEQLKRLWADGWSASQIAVELGAGLTRNAVISKVGRIGIRARSSGCPPLKERRRATMPKPASLKGVTIPEIDTGDADHTLRELGFGKIAPPSAIEARSRDPGLEPALIAQQPGPPAGEGVLFLKRRECQCAYFIGPHLPAETARCCGAETVGGTSWCPEHLALVAQPRELRVRWRA